MGARIGVIQSSLRKRGRKKVDFMAEEAPMRGRLTLVIVSHGDGADCFSPGSLAAA